MPVPHYPADYQGLMNSIRGDSEFVPGEFQWIVDHPEEVKISGDLTNPSIGVSTASSAILNEVSIEIHYTE